MLHDLLEDVGTDEQIENALLVFFPNLETLQWRFHAVKNPAAALGSVDVIDFNTDCAGIDGAGLASVLAIALQFWGFARTKKTDRVEVALEVSKLAVGVEHALALGIGGAGGFGDGG